MEFELRPWRLSDAEAHAAFFNNPRIHCWLRDGIPYPYTVEDAEKRIMYLTSFPPEKGREYCIAVDGKAVGTIGYTIGENISSHNAEIGYYISEEYWGKGIASQALKRVCDEIFATTDIVRITAEVFEGNNGSCRVLEKAGFTREAVLRKAVCKYNRFLNLNLFALLKE